MACYKPLHGYVSKTRNPNGKRNTVFNLQQASYAQTKEGYGPIRRKIPCGSCIGCRLEKSRQWAMRIMHEAKQHEENCFVTLTYGPEHLPSDGSLHLEHFQRFIRALRNSYRVSYSDIASRKRKRYYSRTIRFYHCGEYGEQLGRPHYHACIFGADYREGKPISVRDDIPLFTSAFLEKIWGYGFVSVGELTFESAAYTARYVTKKINGKLKDTHYVKTDQTTGEITSIKSEHATMSRRPGIGATWFQSFSSDAYPKDFITLRGIKMRPPKFYDGLLEKTDKKTFDKVKRKRLQGLEKLKDHEDFTDPRLSVREKCHILTAKQLKRGFENDT